MARSKPSWPSSSKTVSIGQISSRTNSRIQSSFCWNSGSVEKSHAMSVPPPSGRCPQGWQVIRRGGVVGALEIAAGVAVLAGAALQSATGFGFALVSAPLLFAATTPAQAVGLLMLLGLVVNLMTLGTEGRRPQPLVRESLVMLAWAIPGTAVGLVALRALDSTALQIGVTLGVFATLAVRWLAQRRPDAGEGDPPAWAAPAAGLASGALTTSTTTAGPPVVLYMLARGATAGADARHADRDVHRLRADRRGGAGVQRRATGCRTPTRWRRSSPPWWSATSPGGRCSRASPSTTTSRCSPAC